MMLLLAMRKRENDDNTAKTWTEIVTCNELCSSRVKSKQVYLLLSVIIKADCRNSIEKDSEGFFYDVCPQHYRNEQILFNE